MTPATPTTEPTNAGPALMADTNVFDLDVDKLPASRRTTNSKLAARMSQFEAYILALVPGKAKVFRPDGTETTRAMALRVSRAVKRLEKAGNLPFRVIVNTTLFEGKPIVYARIRPADMPEVKTRKARAQK